jgi:histidinol-phosphate aminotransferase
MSGLSRRTFLRLAAAGSAGLAFTHEGRLTWAQGMPAKPPPGADVVMINSNENPLGPCEAARRALADIVPQGGRYLFPMTDELVETFASMHGLKPECVLPYAGSSEPLQYAGLAFTSPRRSVVTANPTYEAAWEAAELNGARSHKVPLTASLAHDVKAMLKADRRAGIYYVCNPNNPTGTTTTRADIEWLLANKHRDAVVLVDEAYIQFSDEPSVIDLVAAGKDLIVLRTFSKIYGMAGIRCGFAVARPDLIKRLALYGSNPMPVTATCAAIASLKDTALIAERKRINAEVRDDLFAWLDANRFKFNRSASNCFMIDTGKPGRQAIAAMQERGVYIGRTWTAWPNHVRITVGTRAEMERFKQAFTAVMAS